MARGGIHIDIGGDAEGLVNEQDRAAQSQERVTSTFVDSAQRTKLSQEEVRNVLDQNDVSWEQYRRILNRIERQMNKNMTAEEEYERLVQETKIAVDAGNITEEQRVQVLEDAKQKLGETEESQSNLNDRVGEGSNVTRELMSAMDVAKFASIAGIIGTITEAITAMIDEYRDATKAANEFYNAQADKADRQSQALRDVTTQIGPDAKRFVNQARVEGGIDTGEAAEIVRSSNAFGFTPQESMLFAQAATFDSDAKGLIPASAFFSKADENVSAEQALSAVIELSNNSPALPSAFGDINELSKHQANFKNVQTEEVASALSVLTSSTGNVSNAKTMLDGLFRLASKDKDLRDKDLTQILIELKDLSPEELKERFGSMDDSASGALSNLRTSFRDRVTTDADGNEKSIDGFIDERDRIGLQLRKGTAFKDKVTQANANDPHIFLRRQQQAALVDEEELTADRALEESAFNNDIKFIENQLRRDGATDHRMEIFKNFIQELKDDDWSNEQVLLRARSFTATGAKPRWAALMNATLTENQHHRGSSAFNSGIDRIKEFDPREQEIQNAAIQINENLRTEGFSEVSTNTLMRELIDRVRDGTDLQRAAQMELNEIKSNTRQNQPAVMSKPGEDR